MNNLKVLAACLVVVFIGLFIFDSTKKKEVGLGKEMEKGDVVVHQAVPKKSPKAPVYSGQELALAAGSKIEPLKLEKETTKGPYAKFPIYKGLHVVEVHGGRLQSPENPPKKILISHKPEHPELEAKVFKHFGGFGFNEDNKMKVERLKKFIVLIQGEGIKVDAFSISYNSNGKNKKDTFLMRSESGKIYRKLSGPLN